MRPLTKSLFVYFSEAVSGRGQTLQTRIFRLEHSWDNTSSLL